MKKILLLLLISIRITCLVSAQTTWGVNNTRTEVRNDAGALGSGIMSGFYETSNPVNFPTGASSWWHLLDVRHSSNGNNYAMQFSGSFFNQELFFRKTHDNSTRPWSKVLLETDGSASINSIRLGSPSQGLVNIGTAVTNIGFHRLTLDQDLVMLNDKNIIGPGGIRLEKFGGSWIDLPVDSGACGIGSGGAGANAWIAYANQPNTWFPNSVAGDICYRNTAGKLLFGNSSSEGAILAIKGNKVGIGTVSPTQVLSVVGNVLVNGNDSVNGNIVARKVKITETGWADYVFEPSYKLPSLKEVEAHIIKYRHLPDVPSAKQVEEDGLDLGSSQATLLKKIEELTLYMIEQNKKLQEQQKQIEALQKEVQNNKK